MAQDYRELLNALDEAILEGAGSLADATSAAIRTLVSENKRLKKTLKDISYCLCYQEMPEIARAALKGEK